MRLITSIRMNLSSFIILLRINEICNIFPGSNAFLLSKQTKFFSKCNTIHSITTSTKTCLHMALTPIGPFCPFRSNAALALDPQMESLQTGTPDFATEMTRLQLDLQMGSNPDPDRLKKVAKGLVAAVNDWELLMKTLRSSNDFQTREYGKLTQAHLESHGQTCEEIVSMMRWQSQCMIAMAENRPPPFPPSNINIMKMMEEAKSSESSGSKPPSMTAMAAAQKITSTPFTGEETAFASDTVREEYERLCRDHSSLIDMGGSYATFDPVGKIAFLDQIELIEERWDIFFARFSLLGQLNQKFVKQCNAFLESMGLSEQNFKDLLKRTHNMMRVEAEKERDQMPY